ncbi:MAG: hypothetical protein IKH13_06380 [Clostridia bacterium]|nr:hypothetical protein [Clostridia bacterium]
MKTGKRLLAALLALIMALSVVSVSSVTIASAADYSSATTLSGGAGVSATLSAAASKTWYKFTATAAATELTFTHATDNSDVVYFTVQVFDSANAPAAANAMVKIDSLAKTPTELKSFSTTIGATYYIAVETNNSAAIGKIYTVKVSASVNSESEDNGSTGSANQLAPGTPVKGILSSADDVDYFKITLDQTYYLNITLTHTPKAGVTAKYYDVTVFFSDGTTRVGSFASLGKEESKSWSDAEGVALKAGTYYIRVIDGGAVAGVEYQITATLTEIPDHDEESENNNSTSEANDITSGRPMIGALDVTNELAIDTDDYYKITVASGAIISFTLSHAVANTSNVYFRAKLIDANGTEITSVVSKGNENIVASVKNSVAAGTYYVRVYRDIAAGDDDTTIPYALVVTTAIVSGMEQESNNDYTSANAIKTGSAASPVIYTASIATKDDIDYFTFKVKRGYAYIRFYSQDNGACKTIYHVDVTRLSSNAGIVKEESVKNFDVDYVDGEFTSACLGLDEGTYYLKVTPRHFDNSMQGQYGVGVQYSEYTGYETEANDTTATADDLIQGSNSLYIGGSAFDKADVDWFKFKTSSKLNATFTLKREYTKAEVAAGIKDAKNFEWKVRVYASTDLKNPIITGVFKSNKELSETVKNLAKGTYYIKVSANSGAYTNKDYSISVTKTESLTWWQVFIQRIKAIDWSNLKDMFSFMTKIPWAQVIPILVQTGKRLVEFIKIVLNRV